jgi:hypothetical protein
LERLMFVAAMCLGHSLSSLLACALRALLELAATSHPQHRDYLVVAVFAFGTPVVAPWRMTMWRMAPFIAINSIAVAFYGASRIARPLIFAVSLYHGSSAHKDFDALLVRAGAAQQSDKDDNLLMRANQPFFRLGASIGLAVTAALTTGATLLVSIWSLIIALSLAWFLYRRRAWQGQQRVEARATKKRSQVHELGSKSSAKQSKVD